MFTLVCGLYAVIIIKLSFSNSSYFSALLNGKHKSYLELPREIDQYMLEQLVSEQLGGFLLIITAAGKIIFISHTVEQLLGHLQVKCCFSIFQ